METQLFSRNAREGVSGNRPTRSDDGRAHKRKEGKRMEIKQIEKILRLHGVPYRIAGARISADSMEAGTEIFEKVEDLTGYTLQQLRDWLGY
jgi:hypothetical protein